MVYFLVSRLRRFQLSGLILVTLFCSASIGQIKIDSQTCVNIITIDGLPDGNEPLVEIESKDWNEPTIVRHPTYWQWTAKPGLYRIKVTAIIDGKWHITKKTVEIKGGVPDDDEDEDDDDDVKPPPVPDEVTIEFAAKRYAIALKDKAKSDKVADAWAQAAKDVLGKQDFGQANLTMRRKMLEILGSENFKVIDAKFKELFAKKFKENGNKMPPDKTRELFLQGEKGWRQQ